MIDWKLGARMLLKHPALTIIGGFSLAAAIAIGVRQLGGGIVAGNGLVLLIAWRADSLTAALVVALAIMSVIMAAAGMLACAAPARRALRVQPTEALRQM